MDSEGQAFRCSMFDHIDAASVEDSISTAYTLTSDWETNITRSGLSVDGRGGASCITAGNNHFHSLQTGLGLSATSQTVMEDNEIAYFSRDGIDVGGNDTSLRRNFIHDTENTSPNHQDGIQGFGPSMNGSAQQYSDGKFHHLLLDGSRVYRQLARLELAIVTPTLNAYRRSVRTSIGPGGTGLPLLHCTA